MKRITPAFVLMIVTISATLFLSAGERKTVDETSTDTEKAGRTPTPLILQENEGDHLVHRAGPLGGVPFTIKIDGQFGNSEDFFVFAETLAPGQTIPFHMHDNAEEILVFEDPGATVIVGDKSGPAGAHSLVFIPRNTWISASNSTVKEVRLLAIFSRHGFESYMRSISAKPGEPLSPLSPGELTRLRGMGHAVYWDSSKGPYPPVVAHP
jgi:mannose-6-phosphate isomerase-like protein (cupin superfamily)